MNALLDPADTTTGERAFIHGGYAAAGDARGCTTARGVASRNLRPHSVEIISAALQTDAVARRILAKGHRAAAGGVGGCELNINVLRSTGIAVHSIHRATSKNGHTKGRGFYRGEVISYLPVVLLEDCFFNVHQGGREELRREGWQSTPWAASMGRS